MPPILPTIPPSLGNRILGLFQRRATWVLVDQGIVSLGNFLTLGVLTRTLVPKELGAYQVLFETILWLNGLQSALVIYPLLVKGATGDRQNLGRLATGSIILTLLLLPFLGGATVASVGALNNSNVAVSAVLALLLWQLQETMRRGLIADLRFSDAVYGDGISYLLQAGLVMLLAKLEMLDLNRAFIVMAATSAGGALLQAWQIGLKPIRFWQLRLIARDFWKLGRWAMLANASGIVTNVGYNWVLLAYHGKEANAIFSAVIFSFKLANPIMNSLTGLITPAVARESTHSMRGATRSALRFIFFGAVLLAPYFLALLIFAGPIMKWLSHGDKPYFQYPHLLRLFVANYSAVFLLAMICAWLGGLGRSRYNFYVSVVNIAVTVLLGLPLTILYGVTGLILGGLFSSGISALVAIYFIYHLAHKPASLDEPPAHSPASL